MPDPTTTAERREEILGEQAEWMHAAAREAQRRLLAAETTDEFVKLTGSLAKLGRGVRQSVLAQDRLESRRLSAQDERTEAALEARRDALDRRKSRIRRVVGRRFEAEWPETGDFEDFDASNLRLERLGERLDDFAEREDFLDLDPDALIARLCEEFGIAPPPPTEQRASTTSPDAASPNAAGAHPAGPRPAGITERTEGAGGIPGGPTLHAPNTS